MSWLKKFLLIICFGSFGLVGRSVYGQTVNTEGQIGFYEKTPVRGTVPTDEAEDLKEEFILPSVSETVSEMPEGLLSEPVPAGESNNPFFSSLPQTNETVAYGLILLGLFVFFFALGSLSLRRKNENE